MSLPLLAGGQGPEAGPTTSVHHFAALLAKQIRFVTAGSPSPDHGTRRGEKAYDSSPLTALIQVDRQVAHRPIQTGLRLPKKAVTPSVQSSAEALMVIMLPMKPMAFWYSTSTQL